MFMRELKIEVSHFDIKTPKLQHGREIRIALISDLHSYMYRNEQEGLIALIEAQSPHPAFTLRETMNSEGTTSLR